MAEFKDYATPNQIKAVEHRGHDILVSASAGSGKTKVLVERIKDEILNENANISRMLIMTFTNAAAKEMKDRLTKILNAELQKQIQNHGTPQVISHLQKQLTAVNVADISTIDSFCLRFLKKYYYAIDLDPNFRVLADESERNVLREDVWQEVRESFYQAYEDLNQASSLTEDQQELFEKYNDFLQVFVQDRRDDDLTDVVYRLNDFASANENPDRWLAAAPQNYEFTEETFTKTPVWKQILKDDVVNKLQTIADNLQQYRKAFQTIQIPAMQEFYNMKEKPLKKLATKTDEDLASIDQIRGQIQSMLEQIEHEGLSWDDLRKQVKQLEFKAKMYAKNRDFAADDDDLLNQIDAIKQFKDAANQGVKGLLNAELFYSDSQLKEILKRAQGVVELVVDLVQKFRQRYLQVKLQRHALEFSDLEYLTLKILRGNDDVQQKIREELQQHYTEIMLDEYQDTNGVQEAIVQAIANHNLFMVGDVKQSIYRFRQADPSLFMHKYQTFKTEETSNDFSNGELIVLQENFRSIKNIADLTNLIFMQIMDQNLGEIDYDQQAFLKAENPAYKKEQLINNIPAKALIYLQDSKVENDSENAPAFELDNQTQAQFVMIANEIKKLMDNQTQIFDRDQGQMRLLQYSDIAILSSSHQDSLLVNEEFKRLGIPTDVDETNNYFKTTEIQIMISYLKTIDNPHQDIPLVAVLRSPMYQFDEDELAYLRINHPHGDFYSTITDYSTKMTDHPEELKKWDENRRQTLNAKVQQFNQDLATFRVQAKRSEIAALIWNIYTTTGFLDYVGGLPGGAQRQANLHALYQRATAYEKTSFKGLFQFIRFVERMDQQQRDLPEMKMQVNEDTVKFMTIHKSKGLEYPVVFVTDLSKRFNMRDLNHKYVLDDQFGIGLDIVESSKQTLKRDYDVDLNEDDAIEIQETTPISIAIKERIKRKALAEEMRKLYVALTRAEQRIYLVGTYADIEKWATAWSRTESEAVLLPENQRFSKGNFMDWIGMALGRMPNLADHTTWITLDDQQQVTSQRAADQFTDWKKYFNAERIPQAIRENALNFEVELWSKGAVAALRNQTFENEVAKDDQSILRDAISQPMDPAIQSILDFQYPHLELTRESAYQAVTDIKRLFDDPDNNLMDHLQAENSDDSAQVELNVVDETPVVTTKVHAFRQPNFMTTEVIASPAKIGTATHLIFQKLDLTQPISTATIQRLIDQLILEGSITKEVAAKIDIDGILAFYQTEVGKKACTNAQQVKREVPFAMLLPAEMLPSISEKTDKPVLIHGIIDGYFEDQETGEVYLFDYKTDHASLKQIEKEYRGQINLYAIALQQITGKAVHHCVLYSVNKRKQIDL